MQTKSRKLKLRRQPKETVELGDLIGSYSPACKLNAPTDIALTFSDYISSDNQKARRFEQLTEKTREFIEELELVSQARVTLISTRFPDLTITVGLTSET